MAIARKYAAVLALLMGVLLVARGPGDTLAVLAGGACLGVFVSLVMR